MSEMKDAVRAQLEAAVARFAEVEQERDAARADCAAMRKALEVARSHGFGACKCKAFDHCVVAINTDPLIEAALSGSAGKELLAELERLRAVAPPSGSIVTPLATWDQRLREYADAVERADRAEAKLREALAESTQRGERVAREKARVFDLMQQRDTFEARVRELEAERALHAVNTPARHASVAELEQRVRQEQERAVKAELEVTRLKQEMAQLSTITGLTNAVSHLAGKIDAVLGRLA